MGEGATMRTITKQYAAFEAKVMAFNAIKPDKIENPDFDRAVAQAATSASRIVEASALTIDEVLVKIRVGLWSAGYPPLDQLDTYVPEPSLATEGTDALCAVREDLRRLRGDPAAPDDPIFAAIAAHKAAETSFSDALTAKERLEREIPQGARQSHIDAFEEVIIESDDPRWIEAERTSNAASDYEDAQARAERPP
jgi:hypothetical protein